jgi:hypothetical protein
MLTVNLADLDVGQCAQKLAQLGRATKRGDDVRRLLTAGYRG